ncbi:MULTISPECIES: 1-acyl-sn-glycerol-3-phosphate acyltransferase [unclassified Lysobacter]|uniref:1-acyl-sn-glycerol-3-phosphate acyltransferase n=1 Tax=unclassified Lysobacter TaxID=2635362 RepID=UPI001BE8FFF3|nr:MULTISPECIES: 1-acyl-sn-glycerol-3-phosphate acyltransferase [unclassified Lysobacter]MBT2745679.1 1-acyl-sn-glycerol-3-phosphate acyltransferase [Lysobacter sp. ISL-42]MBT2749762.1 1-acyl-sn-glycerol-3-phosphate acyltransferase [Lysobacter sp. ISL-50]MBT2777519.1 1-acyl-sn-glycerol-3-phosphate acyltransferase [Lysobacter sp. ISL-54]MBT2782007.1 1-acyl-sn-glycerol-3-phosphate acyltransferase [Lysobacter sp. ISL-52]
MPVDPNAKPSLPPDADGVVLRLPPNVPQVKRNRLTRWIGRSILRIGGWRMVGKFPDIPRAVLIGAPHSSNWDGVWGFAAKAAMGLDVKIIAKDSLFRVPLLGALLRGMGVIPINRSAAHGVIEQATAMIRGAERFWLGIAPEGTRKAVERWKAGFWKIAKAADVPVVPAYFHYPDKIIGIGDMFHLGEDMDADMRRIRDWYKPWQGKHHGTV